MRTLRALLVLSAACILWGFGAHFDRPLAEDSLEEAVSAAGKSKTSAPKELFLSALLPVIADGQALKARIIETRKSILQLDQETLAAKAKLSSVKGVFEPIHSGLASKPAKPDQYGGGLSSRLEFIEKNLTKSLQALSKLPSSCDCAGAETQWKAAAAGRKLLLK
ncbi:MAG: hypothetical protein HY922_03065, partial [Elusimicrobia bacterium]|nr:hypothetical protein [Elusimicrobiota bacterium]